MSKENSTTTIKIENKKGISVFAEVQKLSKDGKEVLKGTDGVNYVEKDGKSYFEVTYIEKETEKKIEYKEKNK